MNLHIHPGVVDEILQRVSTGVEVFELSIVGDRARGWIMRVHRTTDVDRLDVGEVRENPNAVCTGGLRQTSRKGN